MKLLMGTMLSCVALILIVMIVVCNNACTEHEKGKIFSFQHQDSTATSYVKPYCENCNNYFRSTIFRGTPTDTSYLSAIEEYSDGDEIVGGEYYTVTATVAVADHDLTKVRIQCKVQKDNIIVVFSVEFQEEFAEAVGSLKEGDTVTFRGRYYDEGCGFTDAELITE